MIPVEVLEKEFEQLQKRFAGFHKNVFKKFIASFNDDLLDFNVMVLKEWGLENLTTEEGIEFLRRQVK